ncbi:adipokinetic hormone/corazonin-related peptide-like [Neocloeon triangulifer]|uniref:adipokinetic hormone/corazonin-related peptide-like n=1 Tax=Neocloeon triangulifer TaxID=2078957 RepID=UPI00286F59D0|nr:adipokinetic hormone/corazonin-related peptide-like [Neocloeon triangulifer]
MTMAYRYKLPLLMLLAAALVIRHSAIAQVTFSRDWTAGKRSLSPGMGTECSPNLKSTIALCQILISELRQLASCEMRNHLVLNGQAAQEEAPMDPANPFSSSSRSGR